MQAWFECRSCGAGVAVNHLAFEGALVCGGCGVRQALPLELWGDWLSNAHNVADLAGASPPPRSDPIWSELDYTHRELYWGIGERVAYFFLDSASHRRGPTFQLTIGPGHPLCERCFVPLDVSLEPTGQARCSCAVCGEQRLFALPAASAQRFPAIKAVLAVEHLCDRPAVEMSGSAGGGAIGLVCPNCRAPLAPADVGQTVTCSYCHASARIPASAWKIYHGQPEPVRRWWLLFEPPSPLHRKLM